MSFGINNENRNSAMMPSIWRKQTEQAKPLTGQTEIGSQTPLSSESTAGTSGRANVFGGNLSATYGPSGQVVKTSANGGSDSGKVDLNAAVQAAREEGKDISMDTMAKLTSDSPQAFIEGLCEVTGSSPAQVMASLLNMNSSEAAALGQNLAELTGADASSFMPMLSKLTGHDEAMLQQTLNREEDEEENGQSGQQDSTAASQNLNYQRSFFDDMKFPSVDVKV